MMVRMEIGMLRRRIILILLFDFAINIFEGVAYEHRSVQRLFGWLPESRQLKHGQVTHFESSLSIALLIIIAPNAVAAVTASLQLSTVRAHVVAAA